MIAQLGIALFGVLAVWLAQDSRIERRRWAPIFGLAGQPFWFWAAWSSQQWGVFALCFLYSACWARGLTMWRQPLSQDIDDLVEAMCNDHPRLVHAMEQGRRELQIDAEQFTRDSQPLVAKLRERFQS